MTRQLLPLRFLDTETTGLGGTAEICEIAIVDEDGEVLLDTLVQPTIPIGPQASAVNGISDKDVCATPTWDSLHAAIKGHLYHARVYMYNARFDVRMLRQSCNLYKLPMFPMNEVCLMTAFSSKHSLKSYGGRQAYAGLQTAAAHYGIVLPDGLHRARADAELTRRVYFAMMNEGIVK